MKQFVSSVSLFATLMHAVQAAFPIHQGESGDTLVLVEDCQPNWVMNYDTGVVAEHDLVLQAGDEITLDAELKYMEIPGWSMIKFTRDNMSYKACVPRNTMVNTNNPMQPEMPVTVQESDKFNLVYGHPGEMLTLVNDCDVRGAMNDDGEYYRNPQLRAGHEIVLDSEVTHIEKLGESIISFEMDSVQYTGMVSSATLVKAKNQDNA